MAINVDISKITGINQVGNSYQRKSAVPLDYYSLFNTKAEAEAYAASNPVSYVGQVISYIDNNEVKVCVIENANGDLKEVGTAPVGDGKTIEVSAEGAVALLGSATAGAGTLPMLEEVEVEGKKVNKLVWKTLEDIGAGDGNDNTTYEFEFSEQKILVTIKENGVAKSDKVELDLSAFVTADELATELGKLTDDDTKYHLEYDSNNKQIKLVVGESENMTIDATPFIRDGMIEKVELVDYKGEGDDKEEKYLKITWNIDDANATDGDSDKDVVYVPVKDLVDVYTAGNGLDLNGSAFSIKIDAASENFLTVGADGLKLSGVAQAIADGNTTYTIGADTNDKKVKVTLTPNEGNAQSADIDAYNTTAIDAMLYEGKYTKVTKNEDGTTKEEEVVSNITTDLDKARLISTEEIAKLSALVLGEDGQVGVSGTISADNVTGLADKIAAQVTGTNALNIAQGAQVNVIEAITINGGQALPVSNKTVNIAIPTNHITDIVAPQATETYSPALVITRGQDENSNVVTIDDSELQRRIVEAREDFDEAIAALFAENSAHKASNTNFGVIKGDANGASITDGKITSVSTDILSNGEKELVLCAGDANGYHTNH